MSEHFKFSPSGATRWLNCPGSLELPGEDSESSYASEGTAAHAVAHSCWMLGVDADSMIGTEISGYEVDDEMARHVQVYLDAIEATRIELEAEPEDVYLELRIQHTDLKDFGGTVDCLILGKESSAILDFKYGAGVPVEVEGNKQLLCYGMLALDWMETRRYAPLQTVTVVQPRIKHDDGPIRSWSVEGEQTESIHQTIMELSETPSTELNAGDHCQWCPAKINCPELHQLTVATAKSDFDSGEITPEKAASIMESIKPIEVYLDAVEKWAHGQMDLGVEVPGYKLVNTFGNRQYSADETEIVRRCKNKKFGKKQIFETKLLSPAQLEKVVGKDLVSSICERKLKGTTVVPESDRRPAVDRQPVANDFDNVEESP